MGRQQRAGTRRARRHFAYLLRCGDGSYYAGYTVDPARRLRAHRRGAASRYTRGRGPVRLAAVWRCPTPAAARRLERLLKRLRHAARRRLAAGAGLLEIVPEAASLGARRTRRGA
jgi:putative endonuclease